MHGTVRPNTGRTYFPGGPDRDGSMPFQALLLDKHRLSQIFPCAVSPHSGKRSLVENRDNWIFWGGKGLTKDLISGHGRGFVVVG